MIRRSSEKRFEITLQRRIDTQTAAGITQTYEDIGQDFAAIKPLQGREYLAGQQIAVAVDTEIRIHWRPDVDETCRILHYYDDLNASPLLVNIYDIVACLPDMKTGRRELVMMCVKRTAEGWRRGSSP